MKSLRKSTVFVLLFTIANLLLNTIAWGQATGDYRSAATGNWGSASTWQKFDGAAWVAAITAPTSSDGVVTVLSPHVVTLTGNESCSSLIIGDGNATAEVVVSTFALTVTGNITIVSSTTQRMGKLTVNAGTVNIGGDLLNTGTNGNVITVTTGTINISGNWLYGGTLTPGTGTVVFNRAGAQTINNPASSSTSFYNLTIKSTSTTTATTAATINAAGTFTIENSGTYIHNNTVAPASSIYNGIESFGASSNFKIINWAGSSTSFATASVTLPYGNLEVDWNPGVSGWAPALQGTINLTAGNFTITSLAGNELRLASASTAGSPVTFAVGGNLTVANGTLAFIGGGTSQTKVFTANVAGDVSINGTGAVDLNSTQATSGAIDLNIGGNLSITGSGVLKSTLSGGTRTVSFNKASGTQTFSSTAGGINTSAITFNVGTGTSTNTLQLLSGFVMNPTGSLNVLNSATLDCGANIVQATVANTQGNFTLNSGASLKIGSSAGITSSGATGNIQTATTRIFNIGASYEYNGSAAQVTGNGLPATVNNFYINNSAGVTLTNDVSASTLTLGNGILDGVANNKIVSVTNTASTAVSGSSSTSFVRGPLKWSIGVGTYLFPVGKSTSNYFPFTLAASAAASPVVTVEAFDADAGGGATFNATLSSISHTEYWRATLNSGTFTGKVSLTRVNSLTTEDAIGKSTLQGGSYSSIGGIPASPSINNSNDISSGGFFVMASSTSKCPSSTSVSPSTDQIVCQGGITNQLTATVVTTGTNGNPSLQYQWYYNATNSNAITGATKMIGATSSTYTPLATVAEAGTRYYFAIGYAANNGCGQTDATQSLASNTVKVTVNPTSVGGTASSDQTICSGAMPANLSLTGNTGAVVKWQRSTTSDFSSGVTDIAVTSTTLTGATIGALSATTYFRAVVQSGNCPEANSSVVTITVRPPLTASISGTTSVCKNEATPLITFTNPQAISVTIAYDINGANSTSINVGANTTATVAAPTGTAGSFAYNILTVSYQSGSACPATVTGQTAIITVNALPSITASASASSTCFNPELAQNSQLTYTAPTNSPTTYSITWDATPSNSLSPITDATLPASPISISVPANTATGTYTGHLTVKNANGCISSSNTFTLTVTTAITAGLTITPGTNVCLNTNVTYTTEASQSNYLWTISGVEGIDYSVTAGSTGTTSNTVTIKWLNAGSYNVSVSYTSGSCVSIPATSTTTVNPEPARFNVTGGGAYCAGGTGVTINLSNSETGVNYELKNGATIIGSPMAGNGGALSFTGITAAGTYTIVATNTTTSCTSTMNGNAVVSITLRPSASITSIDANICNGGSTAISGTVSATGAWVLTLSNGGGTVAAPSGNTSFSKMVSPTTNATYTITSLTDESGCSTITGDLTGATTISINPTPTLSGASQASPVCDGLPATINVTGLLPNSTSTINYTINGLAQTPATGVVANVSGAGSFITASLSTANHGQTLEITSVTTTSIMPNCTASFAQDVVLAIATVPTATISYPGTPYCAINTAPVTQTGQPNGTYTSTAGLIIDGATGTVNLAASTPGTYAVTYSFGSGTCSNVAMTNITIKAQPVLSNSVTHVLCNGSLTGAIDLTVTGAPAATYSWTGPSGFTAATEDITGLASGSYTILVTSTEGCTATTMITINQPPVLTNTFISKVNNACHGGNSGKITVAASGGTPGYTYIITGPTVNASGVSSGIFTGLTAGSYTITVTDANGCMAVVSNTNITEPSGTVPDATVSVADFTDNFFPNSTSEVTILYQVNEVGGNPSLNALLRITKQAGFTFSLPNISSVTIGSGVNAVTYPLDNGRWIADASDPIFHKFSLNSGETLNCGQSVYLAIKLTRSTPSKSVFVLTSQVRNITAEVQTINNSATLLLVAQ